jgi:uncharacterized lipoprotein YddW (UPF0748 family)
MATLTSTASNTILDWLLNGTAAATGQRWLALDTDGSNTEVTSVSYARYRARGGARGLSDWRRWNVDRYVELVYTGTKRLKPWVKVGISPFGIWRPGFPAGIQGFDSFEKLAGDSRKWLREGWVDYFTPQLYWTIDRPKLGFITYYDWWLEQNTQGRHIWPGMYTSKIGDDRNAAEILRQVPWLPP